MNFRPAFRAAAFFAAAQLVVLAARSNPTLEPGDVAWDEVEKTCHVQLGDKNASVSFSLKNIAKEAIEILEIKPSCGCTTVDVPPLPWKIAPGETGAVNVKIDLAGKFGEMTKTVRVVSTAGTHSLVVHLNVPLPAPTGDGRRQAEEIMRADRQVIFRREECVTCHAHPAAFKTGEPLFQAVCGICHEAEHRATFVPDLKIASTRRDADFWRTLIARGRENTLMPGFAQREGGPLTDEQIESIVEFALRAFPRAPSTAEANTVR